MKLNFYGLWDKTAKSYVLPMFEQTDGLILRNAKKLFNDGSPYAGLENDLVIDRLAEYETSSGVITPITPIRVCDCSSFIAPTSKSMKRVK